MSQVIFSNSIFKHDYEHSVTSSEILVNNEFKKGNSNNSLSQNNSNFKTLSKTTDCTKITKERFIEKSFQTEEISNASSTEKKEHDNNFKKFEKVILQKMIKFSIRDYNIFIHILGRNAKYFKSV